MKSPRPVPEHDPGKPGEAREDRALAAATDAVDAERLLPGEDPRTQFIDDARHWLEVYSELLDFKRFMLDGASRRAEQMSTESARLEIEATDLRVARAEAERFTRRLAYWRGRHDALMAAAGAPAGRD